jgi:hypothetical protein
VLDTVVEALDGADAASVSFRRPMAEISPLSANVCITPEMVELGGPIHGPP